MKNIFTLLFVLSTTFVGAQIKQTAYSNGNGAAAEYFVVDAAQTTDMGYLVLTQNQNQGLYLTRLDNQGNIVWDASYTVDFLIGSGTIEEHPDGTIIISYSEGEQYQRILYLNATGGVIWARDLTNLGTANTSSHVGITIDPNSAFPEFIAFGTYGASNTPYLARLGNGGGIIWQRDYNNSTYMMNDVTITDVVVASTGLIYAVATSPTEKYLMKFDGFGNLLTLKLMNMSLHLSAIIEATNGNIVVAGYNQDVFGSEDVAMMVLDPVNMDILTAKTFGSSNNERATDILQNADGTISLAVHDYSTGDGKMAIYKLDASGANDLEWARAYGGDGVDEPAAVFQKLDEGFTIIGSSNSFSPSWDVYVVMTDVQGVTVGCQEELVYVDETANTLFVNFVVSNHQTAILGSTTPPITVKATLADTLIPYPTTLITPLDPACFGGPGGANLQMFGAVVPFTYLWTNGTSAEDLSNVFAGYYGVVVEDANGCQVQDGVTLVEPSAITTAASSTDVSCSGASDGSVDLTVSGGTPGYSYLWTYNNQVSEDLSGVPGGFYQVTVTDNNGCTAFQSVSVSEPSPLVAGLSSSVNPLCHDDCNGSLSGIVSGGTAPYNYLWNDVGAQSTSTATGLCSGNYLLSVTDANGCATITSGGLQNPDELSVDVTTTASECGLSSGTGNAAVTGGVMPYAYNWPLGSIQDNETGLDIGNYSVQITDANGCQLDESFSIGANTASVDMCVVTVNDLNQNVVVWQKPAATNLAGFNIYRNVGGVYTQIGFTHYDSLSIFEDTEFGIDPTVTSYRYKIAALDSCGGESDLSAFHETIHLTSSLGTGTEVNLIWDNYEGFAFVEYEIWRDTTGLGFWHQIATVPSTNFTYVDNTLPAGLSQVAYAIDVLMPMTCTATYKAQDYNSSRSNRTGITAPGSGSGVEELLLSGANIYPNPSINVINIEVDAQEWEYRLLDLSGREITPMTQSNGSLEQIDVSYFESGMYIVELELNGTYYRHRVIKQ